MENFVHRANLERYRKLLAQTDDADERQRIAKLLAEEEAKDAAKNDPIDLSQ